jgi:nicotinamidase-related amidase
VKRTAKSSKSKERAIMSHIRLLEARDGGLLVIDLQEKLVPRVLDSASVVANVIRLIRGATALEIPVWATEQYPKGLGSTIPAVAALIPHRPDKTSFSCCAVPELVEQLHGRGIRHVTLAGIEAHVCVAQTALELLGMNIVPQIAADAVSSRGTLDRDIALRRLQHAGAVISTTEAVLFEWIGCSDGPAFRIVSALIKESDGARAQ